MNMERGRSRVVDCWNKGDGFDKILKDAEVMLVGTKGMNN